MTVSVQVQGENRLAQVVASPEVPAVNGIVAITSPLVLHQPRPAPMVNDDFGRAMNQNVSFGGTPVKIHDGTDSVLWTGSNIVGTKFSANSTDQAQAGTKSAKIDNPSVNDVWEFNSGSTQALAGYVGFSFFIYVDKDWTTDSIDMYGWDGTADVGVHVRLEDYFDQGSFDVWQFVSIPLEDMELVSTTIESLRMSCVSKTGGKAPKFYIDVLQLEQTGTELEYAPIVDRTKEFLVSRMHLSFADAISGVVTNGTMLGLDYTAFLGVSALAAGIVFDIESGGQVVTEIYTGIGDMCEAGWKPEATMSNGTNTFVAMERVFDVPIILRANQPEDHVSLTVRDNLSGLLSMSAHAFGAQPR